MKITKSLIPHLHFNGLTPAEHERLTILFEEMAEATQVVGKIMRHGYESYNPFDEERTTNRSLLETEIGHVMYAIDMLIRGGEVNSNATSDSYAKKSKSIQKYLHHQDVGVVITTTKHEWGGTHYPNPYTRRNEYRVCRKCGLSDTYVNRFREGDPDICKGKQ